MSRDRSCGIVEKFLLLQLTRIQNGAALAKEQLHSLEQSENNKSDSELRRKNLIQLENKTDK